MHKIIFLMLFVFSYSFACSPYFSNSFCKEINYWNTRPVKYKAIELEPNWIAFVDGYHSFNFIVRF